MSNFAFPFMKSSFTVALVMALSACGVPGPTSSSSVQQSSSSTAVSSSSVMSSSSVSSASPVQLGEQAFMDCTGCHAAQGNGVFGTGGYQFDMNNLRKTSLTGLATYIEQQMPLGKPSDCDATCAANIAAYLSQFAGGSSSSAPGNMGNAFIYDDFESGSNGSPAAGWGTILSWGAVDGPNPSGNNGYALVDSSKAHSGSKSVHIKSTNGGAPFFIYQAIPSNETTIYVRAWMNIPVSLGGGAVGGAGDHAHFLGTLENPAQDLKELRFGAVKKGTLGGFMPKPGDSFTNNTSSISIPANTWTCVEWAVVDDPSFDQMYGWVNGQQVFAATAANHWQNTTPAVFTGGGFTNYISFGWRQFGNVANVTDIWFDDIVVGTERIGCN